MTHKIEIFGQNFADSDGFHGSFLTFFGVKKVVFLIFSKLFKSSTGIVYEFSPNLIGILLVVLSAPKVDK